MVMLRCAATMVTEAVHGVVQVNEGRQHAELVDEDGVSN
jgi:hypothetical protein